MVGRCGPHRSGAVHWDAGCRRDARTPRVLSRGRGEECRHNAASLFAGSSVPGFPTVVVNRLTPLCPRICGSATRRMIRSCPFSRSLPGIDRHRGSGARASCGLVAATISSVWPVGVVDHGLGYPMLERNELAHNTQRCISVRLLGSGSCLLVAPVCEGASDDAGRSVQYRLGRASEPIGPNAIGPPPEPRRRPVSCLDQTQVHVRPLLVRPEPVTVTCTSPAAWAGAMAVVCVDESIVKVVAGAADPYGQRTGAPGAGKS